MIDASNYVSVKEFDVLLTDLTAEDIAALRIEGVQHLSPAANRGASTLNGVTVGENARVLVAAVVSRAARPTTEARNVIMLVNTGSPYVFLCRRTWEALGVRLEDLPNDQAFIVINGARVLAHVSSNHFEDIDVLGASFLQKCNMTVKYPEQKAELVVVPIPDEVPGAAPATGVSPHHATRIPIPAALQ